MEIDSRTVLLTGATGGLGRAIAAELADAGATLVLSARKRDELDRLATELPGGPHRTIVADLAVDGAAEELIAAVEELDVLVANAGIGGGRAVEENDPAAIKRVSRINLEVPVLLAAAARERIRAGGGHLVFVSSLAGKAIPIGQALYAATKAGLRAFALGLRADLRGSGIGVSSISPGFVRDAGMFHDAGGKSPPGFGTVSPEQVGRAVRTAIEDDRAEIDVAPVQQRAYVNFAFHFHGLGKRLERAAGTETAAERSARKGEPGSG
jgi:short-subunit dehydrogenase